jgi:cell division protein ZapA
MAQVTIDVNGRPYQVGCEDGQEAHLRDLAAVIDRQVRQVAEDVGQLGETRLLLMSALLMADELAEARGRLTALSAEVARLQGDHDRVEARAVAALDGAAQKIEQLAAG